MASRLVKVALLVVAVAVAVGSGTLLRQHLDGPDPVDTVKAATAAYSTGDCEALRAVTETPSAVSCAEVRDVRDAYRREGLRPADFSYTVAYRDGAVAGVRINYQRDGEQQEQLVRLEQHGGEWKVTPDSASAG